MGISVLHINSYLKDRTFYKGLFEEQIKSGNNIKVYTPVPYGNRGKADTVGDYVDVEECYHSYERWFFYSKQWKAIKRAEKLYDFSSINIIHAHSMCTNGYIAYMLSEKYDIPYIITVRNGDLNNIYKKALHLRPLFNKVIQNAARVIFLSESYKEDVLENCIPKDLKNDTTRKSIVLPNGIDSFWFEHEPSGVRHVHNPLRLIYAGEINQNKNIKILTDVVNIMNKRGKKVSLNLFGAIKDNSLKKVMSQPNIYYNNTVSKEELIHAYRESDIFIMVSKKEAFGLVYAEALSQGMPIVYTKNQGFDQQFEEGVVGYHVDCNNVESIIDCINRIHSDYENISKRTVLSAKKFHWRSIERRYSLLYSDVLRGNL